MASQLTLAVAGARKTQGIVDACCSLPTEDRLLVLTYTTANQAELRSRLDRVAGDRLNVTVMGWFSFLIGFFARPYLPFVYPGRHIRGFDFDSEPMRGTTVDDVRRYMNGDSVRKVHLPQLAHKVALASCGTAVRHLERSFEHVFIDEVQDLCGYDLEMLAVLMESSLELRLVGDVRQAVLATNPQEAKNSAYKFMDIWKWFLAKEKSGKLTITQSNTTWRCRQEIADFADGLFDSSWGFKNTVSANHRLSGHDGLFLVRSENVDAYVAEYGPLFLRYSKASGKQFNHEFMNYKISKGLTRERVLVLPTAPIVKMLRSGSKLEQQQAAELYVAVTRAEQSVAFVLDDPGKCELRFWEPRISI